MCPCWLVSPCAHKATLPAAEKLTSSAIFPCLSLESSPQSFTCCVFFFLFSLLRNPHLPAMSIKSVDCSVNRFLLDSWKCKQLHEITCPGKMIQFSFFQPTGETENVMCFTTIVKKPIVMSSGLDNKWTNKTNRTKFFSRTGKDRKWRFSWFNSVFFIMLANVSPNLILHCPAPAADSRWTRSSWHVPVGRGRIWTSHWPPDQKALTDLL